MEDNGLKYVKVTSTMKDMDKLAKLYNTAFPPEERLFSIEEASEFLENKGGVDAKVVYDGDTMIGFYAISVYDDYKYLQFIATDPTIRGKGYGGKILRKLLDDNKDGIFFASIERPDPDGKDYEIKLRRKQFYERNGMITVDRRRNVNGVDFIIVTNKTGDEFDHCYDKEMIEEKKEFAYKNITI